MHRLVDARVKVIVIYLVSNRNMTTSYYNALNKLKKTNENR
jgi:hypothetical protein